MYLEILFPLHLDDFNADFGILGAYFRQVDVQQLFLCDSFCDSLFSSRRVWSLLTGMRQLQCPKEPCCVITPSFLLQVDFCSFEKNIAISVMLKSLSQLLSDITVVASSKMPSLV